MSCSLTPFSGQVPNTGQTAEQNIQDCTNFMQWLVGTFVPEFDDKLPAVCAAAANGDMQRYLGEYDSSRQYVVGDVVSWGNTFYVAKIDNPPAPPAQTGWVERSWGYTKTQADNKFATIASDYVYYQSPGGINDKEVQTIDASVFGNTDVWLGAIRTKIHSVGGSETKHISLNITANNMSFTDATGPFYINIDLNRIVQMALGSTYFVDKGSFSTAIVEPHTTDLSSFGKTNTAKSILEDSGVLSISAHNVDFGNGTFTNINIITSLTAKIISIGEAK